MSILLLSLHSFIYYKISIVSLFFLKNKLTNEAKYSSLVLFYFFSPVVDFIECNFINNIYIYSVTSFYAEGLL